MLGMLRAAALAMIGLSALMFIVAAVQSLPKPKPPADRSADSSFSENSFSGETEEAQQPPLIDRVDTFVNRFLPAVLMLANGGMLLVLTTIAYKQPDDVVV